MKNLSSNETIIAFLRDVAKPPYADSNPHDLLESLRTGAERILAGIEARKEDVDAEGGRDFDGLLLPDRGAELLREVARDLKR